jgi:hypothetical protein
VIDYGRMVYWAVFLPRALASLAVFAGGRPVRMRGRVGGTAGGDVALAWQRKNGRRYILISKALAKQIGASPGTRVHVAFDLVDDEAVVVPDEIEEAMCQEAEWRALWKKLTPGQRRAASHRVSSAKSESIRADRAIQIFRDLEEGRTPGPPARRRVL